MKILDTHLGSGTIAVAAHLAELDLVAFEISEKYVTTAESLIREKAPSVNITVYGPGKLSPRESLSPAIEDSVI